jgi:hypothetical protein
MRLRSRLALAVAAIFIYGFLAICSITFFGDRTDAYILRTHFASTVGLPMAAALAFIVVLLFPASYGPIEFKAVGLTFKGASGPVVLWLLCFLGIVLAVKLTW